MKKLVSAIFVLALLGAGCSQSANVSTEVKTETPKPTPTPVAPKPSEETPKPILGGTVDLKAAVTDGTWKTYSSAALDFSFMWPTKGRYAPEWEVKSFAAGDAHIKDGCYSYEGQQSGSKMVTVGGREFCHTSGSDNGAGQHYVLDAYATQIGKSTAVILFTKHTVNADAMDCPDMKEQYSTSSSACIPFVEAEYEATLNGIVGTFKMDE